MSSWRTVKLRDICRFKYGEMPKKADLSDDGYPIFSGYRLVGRSTRYHYRESEIIVVARGVGGTGDIKMTPPFCFLTNLSIAIIIEAPDVDKTFLYYRLVSTSLWELRTGSAQAQITIERLKTYEVALPPLPIQQRIARILSAYDELIENSQRRIKILESMARALYREWFVHFRFPGSDSIPRIPSPLGEIPQGWEMKKLADFVTTKYGYTESSNTSPVGPKYLRGMDINKTSYIDWSEVPYCPITDQDFETYRLRIGDVLVIRMADPGKVGIVEQDVDAVFASYLIRVTPKNDRVSPYFLFYLMGSPEYYAFITGASTGTTRKSASAGVITEYQFVVPSRSLIQRFEGQVREIRALLNALLHQTVNLRRTRDLLLPRLLSGQIDVEALAS